MRNLVFSPTPNERDKEIATIAALADFYAQSTQSLEALVEIAAGEPASWPLYADIKKAESQAVTTTNTIIEQVREGNVAAVDTLWSTGETAVCAMAGVDQPFD